LIRVWDYLGILSAAAIEGEVVYVTAVVAASLGKLDVLGVLVSGAVGGWAGDQFWFYTARGHFSSWLNRFANVKRRSHAIRARMHRHATKFIVFPVDNQRSEH
jgi:membrane protein DedA with SNARE-associated domain